MDDQINENMSKYIIDILEIEKKISNWINGEYKNTPLVIYGDSGTGKTKLANYILKEWVRIVINIEICKNGINFNDYIESSLNKKSITMMFSNNRYKSLIIDDISYIQVNDKKIYKSIIDFSKKNKNTLHPIIYIFNNINHKSIQLLLNNCCLIHMNFTHDNLKNIVKKFLDKNQKIKEIDKLILNSNNNLNSIITNISFHKENYGKIDIYDKKESELSDFIKDILKSKDIKDIYLKSLSDYNIIVLNIIENFYGWIKKKRNISNKEKIAITNKVYEHTCYSDYILNKMYVTNDWSLINHIITNGITYPYCIIKSKNITINKIDYNKYISRCIIYTYNNNLLYSFNFNNMKLSYLYYLLEEYIKNKDVKTLDIIKGIIEHYSLSIKFIEKFIKYYRYNLNKKEIKIFCA